MRLDRLSLLNFKNFQEVSINLSAGLNCFVGANGAGKTNLLDAVHYLSMSKSFLMAADIHSIRHQEEFFVVQGDFFRDGREERIYCGVKRGMPKTFKRNGKDYEKISDHIGLLPVVFVSPYDTNLIDGPGEERRRYLNSVISQLDSAYLTAMMDYNRVLSQRNRFLKQAWEKRHLDEEVMDVLDLQLSALGAAVYERRRQFVDEIVPLFNSYYQFVSGGKEKVELGYESSLSKMPLVELLKMSREKDRFLQHTSVGVHRDDIELLIDGFPVKRVGSQGQQKTVLIALKLAQFDYISRATGLKPLLLLDDIFDKLDMQRVEQLIALVAGEGFSQIFITDSNKTRLDGILRQTMGQHRLFRVEDGLVIPVDDEK
ncbi:MAG TPA: DNA replication/repair protein RecF [Williamwhitmania sp.]|nr:DNA replication/repair protein RecF [Williamwhitmania sp.]